MKALLYLKMILIERLGKNKCSHAVRKTFLYDTGSTDANQK